MKQWMIALCLLLIGGQVLAEGGMLMTRVDREAPTTMAVLQQELQEHGYAIAHVQKCDTGMGEFGYQSDYYRVVFFGKVDEVRRLSDKYPELIPYLPLKIVVFAEGDETVLAALNTRLLAHIFPQRELQVQFMRWYNDIQSVLRQVYDQS